MYINNGIIIMVPLMVYLFWDQTLCQQFSSQALVAVEPCIDAFDLQNEKNAITKGTEQSVLQNKIFLMVLYTVGKQ